ncbi:MAG: SDR family NAD(P)-dependent oxidoreductase, partial [Chloroflexota bacterium]
MTRDQGRLSEKVVVVIGGARGIGRGIAEQCAAEGARLVIADRSPERDTVALALGQPSVAIPLDARVAEDHARVSVETMERFGRIDVLVYCAGIFPRATLLETDEALWRSVLDTNLTGAFFACRAVVPHMAARGGGAIITIGSLHAQRGSANMLAYAVSK